jgi:hypothetical protein
MNLKSGSFINKLSEYSLWVFYNNDWRLGELFDDVLLELLLDYIFIYNII